jgi:hypothetical protein
MDLPPGWQDLSAQGLVALFVLMVFLGWLIPKRLQDKRDAEKDATIAFQRETIEKLTGAVQDLTVTAHTGPIALRSIAKQADKAGDE